MFDPTTWSLATSIFMFLGAACVIGIAGWLLTGLADRLADITGLGEAIAGALLLGATTSLPGIITSIVTASRGYPALSVSNALGGIAAQTVFLVIADISYRNANLEHAAAEIANMLQGTLLVVLLSIPLLAATAPEITFLGMHPASPIMIGTYIYGLRLVKRVRNEPMWSPRRTTQTSTDEPDDDPQRGQSITGMWVRFALLALIIGGAGWVIGRSGENIAQSTGLSETVVGGLFTAITTSLPELVTSLAAVRRGALTMAVSGIIGGNVFDTLFIAVADIAYRDGSIYHALASQQLFLMAMTILMIGVLLMGLIRREQSGPGNIGFESVLVLLLYIGGFVLLFFSSTG